MKFFKYRICLHKYRKNREKHFLDIAPPFSTCKAQPTPLIRTCIKCGQIQRWLPGYGGSEEGCWMTVTKSNKENQTKKS